MREAFNWRCRVHVDKWDDDATAWVARRSGLVTPNAQDFAALKVRPYEVTYGPDPGNQLLDTSPAVGVEAMMKHVFGASQYSIADQTHSGLGVGNSTTADANNQTGLSASSPNRCWMQSDSTFPTVDVNTGVVTLKATFGSSLANFAWEEYGCCIPNQAAAPTVVGTSGQDVAVPTNYAMLNRKSPAALGTKGSGSSWALTMTLTIT
jgi:hypothetical protein